MTTTNESTNNICAKELRASHPGFAHRRVRRLRRPFLSDGLSWTEVVEASPQRAGTSHRWMVTGAVVGIVTWVWFQVWLWSGLGRGDFSSMEYSEGEWAQFVVLMAMWASLWAIGGAIVGLGIGAAVSGLRGLLRTSR